MLQELIKTVENHFNRIEVKDNLVILDGITLRVNEKYIIDKYGRDHVNTEVFINKNLRPVTIYDGNEAKGIEILLNRLGVK